MALLLCVLVAVSGPGHAQDLEGWIQRLGEAAAESAPPTASADPTGDAPAASGCVTQTAPGDLVVRGGGPCAARQMAETLLRATRAMNARAPARDCRGVDGCRPRTREDRLRQVASMNHEEREMARSHGKGPPSNVALPPPRVAYPPNWTWRPYR